MSWREQADFGSVITHDYHYVGGSPTVNGTWRFYVDSSGDLVFQKRESGSWTEKLKVEA